MQRIMLIIGLVILIGVSVAIFFLRTTPESPKAEATATPTIGRFAHSQAAIESEEYAVYSALIKGMYIEDAVKLLVIYRDISGCVPSTNDEKVESMRRSMEEHAIKNLPELMQDTLDNYRVKGKECHTLRKQFNIPVKYLLVTDKDIEPLFPKGEVDRVWRRFYNKYPKSSGIISLSNIGLNGEMTQALVYTGRSCGGLCGAGYYVMLTKEDGFWSIKSKINTWVS
jgi:hypothetical protein